jgi:hypothetical protein
VSGGAGASPSDQTAATDTTRTGREPADVLDVSQSILPTAIPSGTLGTEDLREITSWLAAGGHDNGDVHQAIADAIHADVRGDQS